MEEQLRHSQQMEIDNLRSKFIEYLETEHKVKVTAQGNSPLSNTLIVHTEIQGYWIAIDTNYTHNTTIYYCNDKIGRIQQLWEDGWCKCRDQDNLISKEKVNNDFKPMSHHVAQTILKFINKCAKEEYFYCVILRLFRCILEGEDVLDEGKNEEVKDAYKKDGTSMVKKFIQHIPIPNSLILLVIEWLL